jgi:YcaO-like protein with predicted kinase domain
MTATAATGTGATSKAFRDGTHRAVSPTKTLERVRPWLAHMGITRVANVTGLDTIGLPVVMVVRPDSRSVSVSQGKGLTLDAAKASGVMESAELWHAETALLALRFGSEEALAVDHRVADTDALATTASTTYRRSARILWTSGRDAADGGEVWLPYECVHMNSTLPLPAGSGVFLSTSNGLASGNCFAEALVHGLCEVIERDATALWHALPEGALAERAIDLDSVDDAACMAAIEMCFRARVAVMAWDMTSDVGVPAFAALIRDVSDSGADRSAGAGYGCHTTRGIALFRAISEAAQSRLTFIAGARDDVFRREYEDGVRGRLALRWLQSTNGGPGRRFADVPSHEAPTFEEDIRWLLDRLHSVGVDQAVLVDLTSETIGIPVVRVVVPGLEGPDSDPEYRAGRRREAVEVAA